jgi:hypothetical protein
MARWLGLILIYWSAMPTNVSAQLTYFLDIAPLGGLHDQPVDLKEAYTARATKILESSAMKAVDSKEAARLLVEVRYAFEFSNGKRPGALERYWDERIRDSGKTHLNSIPEYMLLERWYFWDRKANRLVGFVSRIQPPTPARLLDNQAMLGLDLQDEKQTTDAIVQHSVVNGKGGGPDPVAGVKVSLSADDRVVIEFKDPKHFYQFVPPSTLPQRSIIVEITYDKPDTFWSTRYNFESDTYKLLAANGWGIAHPGAAESKDKLKFAASWNRDRHERRYERGEYHFTLTLYLSVLSGSSVLTSDRVEASTPNDHPSLSLYAFTLKDIYKQLAERMVYETIFQKLDARAK